MGLFNNRKKTSKNLPSFVADTEARRMIQAYIDYTQEKGERLDQIASMVLYTIATFRIPSNEITPNIVDKYNGDMPLFEFGCFWMFLIDLWYSQHKSPSQRNIDVNAIMDKFVMVFSKIIEPKQANKIINDRLQIYASLLKEPDHLKYQIEQLNGLMYSTVDNETPMIYENNIPPLNLSAVDNLFVTTAIGEHFKAFFPLQTEIFNKF